MNLIDGLPRNSAFAEAQSQDEDLAKHMLKLPPPDTSGSGAPPMRDMSPEMGVLMLIFDRLGELIQATVAAAGRKPPKIVPLPRPTTAYERLRHNQVLGKHHSIADRMLGRTPGTSAVLAKTGRPAITATAPPRRSAGVPFTLGTRPEE